MDEVIIPGTHNGKPVTQVADYAFVGDSRGTFACEKIVLPDTIQRIGNNAFEDCRSLVEVNIPDSVDAIGNMAFNNTAVSTIEIPEGVTEIGSNIFNSRVVVRCEAVMKGDGWRSDWIGVDMPVIWNCNYSNAGDDGNTYLIAGGGLYKVTDSDAQFLGLSEKTGKNLTIAARFTYDGANYSVKRIAEAALLNGRIESLTVEEGIEEIGINAFSSCSNLTSVALPDGLKHIESTAFSGCGALEYVILPESLSDIGEYAFEDCYSLDGIYYKGTSALWGEVDVRTGNDDLNLANLYFYAASKPQEPATFWHYDQYYNPILWTDDGYVMVAFDLNYEDGAAPSQVYVKSGDKLVRPEDPVRESYEFSGWCTDADCTQAYDFTRPVTAEITLYADWGDNLSYVFEAEDVVLDGKYGVGLSGTAGGAMMIQTGTELGASNNLFVGYQYAYGCSISFAIVSDATVSDAKITLRLSAEYRDISIDTQSYLIELNGEPLTYNIEFKGVPSPDGQPIDINTIYALPFSDYVIAEDVTLREGVNVITLTTNNYDALAGTTMLAAAPLIDCLKIKTSATLEWSEADGYPADNY